MNWLSYTKIGVEVHRATGAPFEVSFTQPSNQIDSKKCSEICSVRTINHHLWRNREGWEKLRKRSILHSYRLTIGQIYWPVFLKKIISLGSAFREYAWENSALHCTHILKPLLKWMNLKYRSCPSLLILQLYISANWGFWDLRFEML